jgi:hypothetical protein
MPVRQHASLPVYFGQRTARFSALFSYILWSADGDSHQVSGYGDYLRRMKGLFNAIAHMDGSLEPMTRKMIGIGSKPP